MPNDVGPWVKGGPTGTFDTLTAGSWWLSRELEVAALNRSDVTIFDELKQVESKLVCSKDGSRATGQGRTHVCRCTGIEAFTAATIEVAVAQIFGRWGRSVTLHHCQEAPRAGSVGIAAMLRKPDVSVASAENSEAEWLHTTVSRLEALVEEQRNDLSALTYQTLQALRDEEKDDEVPQQPLAAGAVKVVNLDYDRHSPASRGMVGVVHIARVLDEEVPPQLWRAR